LLPVSARAQAQDAYQARFGSGETVYRSCLDMQALQQEVFRVVLLDGRFRRITAVDVTKGTVNESLAHPGEIFRRSDQGDPRKFVDTYRCTRYPSDARSEMDLVLSISDPLTLCLARSPQKSSSCPAWPH
jgi:hypothetical protein